MVVGSGEEIQGSSLGHPSTKKYRRGREAWERYRGGVRQVVGDACCALERKWTEEKRMTTSSNVASGLRDAETELEIQY